MEKNRYTLFNAFKDLFKLSGNSKKQYIIGTIFMVLYVITAMLYTTYNSKLIANSEITANMKRITEVLDDKKIKKELFGQKTCVIENGNINFNNVFFEYSANNENKEEKLALLKFTYEQILATQAEQVNGKKNNLDKLSNLEKMFSKNLNLLDSNKKLNVI